jgi:hypothetical protein
MAKGDNVVLTCPHCGQQSTYKIRGEGVTQNENCYHCRKLFSVEISGNGEVKRVRK